MRRPVSCVVLLSCGFVGLHAEEPRALIERAVKAMGAEVDPAKRPALLVKVRFQDKGALKGTGEFMYQPHKTRRCDLVANDGNQRSTLAIVLEGANGWAVVDGGDQPLMGQELFMVRGVELLFAPAAALPLLLDDKGVSLKLLPEAVFDGKAVQVVQVAFGGKQTVELSFDKQTGLPVKTFCNFVFGSTIETVASDWQDAGQAADEGALKGAGVGVEPAALLAFLRKHVPDPATTARAAALVKRLGDDAFDVREKAGEDLLALGSIAVSHLERALKDSDAEVARRAEECLAEIRKRNDDAVLSAAIRQVVVRKVEGGDAALLALLPGANAVIASEAKAALVAVGVRDGKPTPALLAAHDDRDAVIRSAAAAVLGKDGGEYLKQPGRRLYVRGPKVPAKITVFEGSKTVGEMDILDVQLFNLFEGKRFVKP